MFRYTSSLELQGDVRERTVATLLDAVHLPDWNPAIWNVRRWSAPGAADQEAYRVDTRIGKASMDIRRISDCEVAVQIRTPLLTETSGWTVHTSTSNASTTTVVTHWIEYDGIAGRLLRPAFSSVPDMRLARLGAHVQATANT